MASILYEAWKDFMLCASLICMGSVLRVSQLLLLVTLPLLYNKYTNLLNSSQCLQISSPCEKPGNEASWCLYSERHVNQLVGKGQLPCQPLSLPLTLSITIMIHVPIITHMYTHTHTLTCTDTQTHTHTTADVDDAELLAAALQDDDAEEDATVTAI